MIKVRAGTLYDLVAAGDGDPMPKSCRAWVIADGERVLGAVGIVPHVRRWLAFIRVTKATRDNFTVPIQRGFMLAGAKMLREAAKRRMPVQAIPDPSVPGAINTLEHAGFKKTSDGVYQWTPAH